MTDDTPAPVAQPLSAARLAEWLHKHGHTYDQPTIDQWHEATDAHRMADMAAAGKFLKSGGFSDRVDAHHDGLAGQAGEGALAEAALDVLGDGGEQRLGPVLVDGREVDDDLEVAAELGESRSGHASNLQHVVTNVKHCAGCHGWVDEGAPCLGLALAPTSPAGLDVERLTRALVDISTRDEPLEPDERIVAIALEPDAPENMAALIADAYRAVLASPEEASPDA